MHMHYHTKIIRSNKILHKTADIYYRGKQSANATVNFSMEIIAFDEVCYKSYSFHQTDQHGKFNVP